MTLTAGKLYRSQLREHWVAYLVGVATLLVTSLSEVAIPRYIQWALDMIGGAGRVGSHQTSVGAGAWFVRSTPLASLHAVTLAMVITLIFGLAGRWGWRQVLARRTHQAGRDLKVRYWDSLKHQPLSRLRSYPLGDLMNRATGDWNASRAIHGFTVVITLDLIFFTGLSIANMLAIDVGLSVYCLVVFPFLPRLILRLARQEHDLHLFAQEKLGQLSTSVSQALSTVRLQRATAGDARWQEAFRREAREYADRRYQVIKTGWRIFPLAALPTLVAYAVLLFWGVHKIRSGELTVGAFVALQSYVLMLQNPLFDMGDCIAEWQRGFASLGRIAEIFALKPQVSPRALANRGTSPLGGAAPGEQVPELKSQGVEIQSLTFAYAKTKVLQDLRLSLAPGAKMGIVGAIGAGKSTLLALLAGLLEAPTAAIKIGGVDVTKVPRSWFKEHVTLVPQRAFLFAGTVRYNLELDQTQPTAELWEVLRVVQLDEDVRRMPAGLESWIGEFGVNLSGGQKQRLALARALLRQKPFVLLDDSLSAVDAVTEDHILRAMQPRLRNATVVWVAHRLSTLAAIDQVYLLEHGQLRSMTSKGGPGI